MPPPQAIQPVVLVGGRSSRFGRDKLRERFGGGWLVDRPLAALREVFGPVVAAVGECSPEVAARFDRVIPDSYPGTGPAGGILSALQQSPTSVFVLAGDLPAIGAHAIRAVLAAADDHPQAAVIMAIAERPEPCVALYRRAAEPVLVARLASGLRSLHDAFPVEAVVTARVPIRALANVNTPADLEP